MRKPNGHWTKERCRKIALRYSFQKDFRSADKGAFLKAFRMGWLGEICSHMQSPLYRKNRNLCTEAASTCLTLHEFTKRHATAYKACLENGWQDVYAHLHRENKPFQFWHDIENCRAVAAKCSSRDEFQKKYKSAYCAAHRLKFLDEICKHMVYPGNIRRRGLYAYEFSDNSVYVGLTWNYDARHKRHLKMDSYLGPLLNSVEYHYLKFEVFYEELEAAREENLMVEKYLNSGWTVLNRAVPGSLGGSRPKWTLEKCMRKAKKFKTRTKFMKAYPGAYISARLNGWLEKICEHMIRTRAAKNHWQNKEVIRLEALKYSTRKEFSKKAKGAYAAAYQHGWLSEVCEHMILKRNRSGTWNNIANLKSEAEKFESRAAFQRGSRGAYQVARIKGLLNLICRHMSSATKPKGYWNIKPNVALEATKYSSRSEFSASSKGAYHSAMKNDWLDEVCQHMVLKIGRWQSKANVIQEARKYPTKKQFPDANATAYNSARKHGWLKEACAHMPRRGAKAA